MNQVKLTDLVDFLPKSRFKAGAGLQEGQYPFYTSSESQSKYLNEYLYAPGCLVFGTGGRASVHLPVNRFATSTDCITIRPKANADINAAYVYQYFKSNMRVLDLGFKGAGLKHLSKGYLSELQVPYPEALHDRLRVANLLSSAEGLVVQRKRHLRELDGLIKSTFFEMFGDPVKNERGWDKPRLSNFGEISTGNTPPRRDTSNYSRKHIEWIKTDNIVSDSVYVTEAAEHLSAKGAERGRTATEGALLVACIAGSVESIGRAALIDRTVAFNQQINAIQPHEDINPLYLYILFKLSKAYIQGHASKGMKKILTKGEFEEIPMIKPPVELQNQFGAIVQKTLNIRRLYEGSLSQLDNLYSTLGQRAFKGELDLSRVPLTPIIGNREITEVANTFDDVSPTTDKRQGIQLPDVESMTEVLTTPEGRRRVIQHWLDVYTAQLEGAIFSVNDFLDAAQTHLSEFHPENGFEVGHAEYEQVKDWVFSALSRGALLQVYDDSSNRAQLVVTRNTK